MTSNHQALAIRELVQSLRGRDIDAMGAVEEARFKRETLDKYATASAVFPRLLRPDGTTLERFQWHVEPAEFADGWIGTFKFSSLDRIEASLDVDLPIKVRMAVAQWPDVEVRAILSGAYRYPGGRYTEPSLQLGIRAYDSHALATLISDRHVCTQFSNFARDGGFDLSVETVEGAAADQLNPTDLRAALASALDAALQAADGDAALTEAINVHVTIPCDSAVPEVAYRYAFHHVGELFSVCDAAAGEHRS